MEWILKFHLFCNRILLGKRADALEMGSVKIRWRRTEPVFRDRIGVFHTERRGIFMEIHELQQLAVRNVITGKNRTDGAAQ